MIYFLTVNYYSSELICKLVDSIQQNAGRDPKPIFKLVIVNNAVDDTAIANLENDCTQVINATDNLGFGRACNLGLNWIYERDPRSIIWIINPDAYLESSAIAQLSSLLHAHPEIAILGTAVYDASGHTCFKGGRFSPRSGAIWEETETINKISKEVGCNVTDWVTACSMVINFKHFPQCPYFDPDYFLYYEDFDFCRRYAKQGYRIYFSDRLRVIHQTSSITSRNLHLKTAHEIYSYLLSLEKHTSGIVLGFRLVRIAIASVWQMLYQRPLATSKLAGINMYCQRRLGNPSRT